MPPMVLVALAWLAGLVAAHHWLAPLGVPPRSLLLVALIPAAAWLLWRKDASVRLAAACCLALLLGAIRYQAELPDLNDPGFVSSYNNSGWVMVEGVVDAYPDARDRWTHLRLAAEWIEVEGDRQPVEGLVQVSTARYPQFAYGDRLRVMGAIKAPAVLDDFDYEEYLARKGIYSAITFARVEKLASGEGHPLLTALYAVKNQAAATISRMLPEPEAALLQGILLGLKTAIPRDLYEQYNDTGTSHVLVISGANITLVSALFFALFGRLLGKRLAYWFALTGIGLYVMLVGADAAVLRAGLMGALFLTAIYLGRQATAYVSLLVTALVLTLISPFALWDVGFQLSFAATLGLILLVPLMETWLEGGLARIASQSRARQAVDLLAILLITTLAAQVLTIPLVMYHFGRLSLIAPLANLLIQPAQMPIMSGGALATVIGLVPVLAPLAQVLYWLPWLFVAYTNAIVQWLATWPLAAVDTGPFSAGWLIGYYALVGGAIWLLGKRTSPGQRARVEAGSPTVRWAVGGLVVVSALVWLATQHLPDGRLHVAFLDVGQGDSTLITTPTGRQILVDGGPSPNALTSALGREMPFWDRSLDLVVLTHADADHITGLVEALDRYRVDGWLDNGQGKENALYAECLARLEASGVPTYTVRAGDRLDLERGITLEVLHPAQGQLAGAGSNDNSVVVRLHWDRASFLLTGDLEAEGEAALLESGQGLASGVLKVAHHGSDGSSTAAFLETVAPAYAVIPVGENSFGHPAPGVLDRLAALAGVEVLRTDERGTVEFVTDGRGLWVETER